MRIWETRGRSLWNLSLHAVAFTYTLFAVSTTLAEATHSNPGRSPFYNRPCGCRRDIDSSLRSQVCRLLSPQGTVLASRIGPSCDAFICGQLAYSLPNGREVCGFLNTPLTSMWNGVYDIHYNNCHHAANDAMVCAAAVSVLGVPSTTRVVACRALASTEPNRAHTVNITLYPMTGQDPNPGAETYCIWDPQAGNDQSACCWREDPERHDADITTGPGLICAGVFCHGQLDGTQRILPGRAATGAAFCASLTNNSSECLSCCQRNTWNSWVRYWPSSEPWGQQCRDHCNARWH